MATKKGSGMSGNKLLDTNIVLYYLAGKLSQAFPQENCYVSIITEMELLSYSGLNKKEELQIKNFLSELIVVELNNEIKELTISIRRKFSLKLPDAIIAATALTLRMELLSNDQQFLKIPKLHCTQLRVSLLL